MMREAITASSRAVLLWPGSERPVTFLNAVFFSPQACACRFIIATKLSSEPATPSASATDASLPDCTTMPRTSSSTFGVIVVSMNISEPPPLRSAHARIDTGSVCSSESFLSRIALNTRYAVISFVSDAGSALASASRSASVCPVVRSISR